MKTTIKSTFYVIAAISAVALFSCKKNGTGGKAEIHAMVYHGSTPIKASTLYVKFDAKSQPSDPTTDFDLKLQGEPDDNHVHVEDMRRGDYYLYAVGYDSVAHVAVKGGVATTIKWSERKELKEVEVQVTN